MPALPTVPIPKPRAGAPPFRRIILPVDFSVCAERALPRALAIAERAGAEVFLLHVLSPQPFTDAEEKPEDHFDLWRAERARTRLQTLRMSYRHGLNTRREVTLLPIVTTHADAAEGIVRYARRIQADLIVMGTHGWTASHGHRLGSVAQRIIEQAPCPVMTVPVHRQVIGEVRRVIVPMDNQDSPSPASLLADRVARLFGGDASTHVSAALSPRSDVDDADLIVAPDTVTALRYVHHYACAVLAPAADIASSSTLPQPTAVRTHA